MKRIWLLTLFIPTIAFAQNKQDHASLVEQFVNYYNKQQTDNICTLFPDERSTGIKCFWKGASTDGTYNIYGTITAHEYMGVDSTDLMKVTKYKLRFSKKGAMVMSFDVSADHKFTIFRLEPIR